MTPTKLLLEVPELARAQQTNGTVRIPPGIDVPLTARVRRLIDTAAFRRLGRISQLGLVGQVYPAANHSRLEHSLGVFHAAIEYVRHLARDPRFASSITPRDAELFLVAALLHDVGHWPFCHPIEDIQLPTVPSHEKFARKLLASDEIASAVREDWQLESDDVANLLAGKVDSATTRILRSMLSGPIDVDKVDYLMRDSLHAGVPYGRNFDVPRLIGSLCLNEAGDGLAITEKGKTAAEMMVFARYVMFSEVYWHHAVRAATAMLQRAFYDLHREIDLATLFELTDQPMIDELARAGQGRAAESLLAGLFGPLRQLYKRLAQYSVIESPELYLRLARRPYPWLCDCAEAFARLAGDKLGARISPHDVLFDAPPVKLEVEFDVDVYYPKSNAYRRLGDVSPVVKTLAREQFDNYVKRVRIFVSPRLLVPFNQLGAVDELVVKAIDETDNTS